MNPIGTPFIELPTVESTNNYAMGLVHEGMAQHGMAVFAHEQTRGKGQREKTWISDAGKNIALSVVIAPQTLAPSEPFLLSMAVAVATAEFLSKYTVGDISIKWPNDIYWRDRKAAGILIENVWQGTNWKFAVAGIGININQAEFGELDNKAVSLKQITGRECRPVELARLLCDQLEIQYMRLLDKKEDIIRDYRSRLYQLNRPVRLKQGNRQFDAVIKDVTTRGELLVFHQAEELFQVGEVEWMKTF